MDYNWIEAQGSSLISNMESKITSLVVTVKHSR